MDGSDCWDHDCCRVVVSRSFGVLLTLSSFGYRRAANDTRQKTEILCFFEEVMVRDLSGRGAVLVCICHALVG